MDKNILIQYCDLQEEIKDLHKRIERMENQINKLEDEGAVIDTVKGGMGGIQNFKIQGFPYGSYSKKKTLLYTYKLKLESAELELLEKLNNVEEYMDSITDSRKRRILRYRYVDSLNWVQIANKLGGCATADSVRMEHNRFLEN